MRAYPLLHAPRYEEEVGCRANAENEFVALKKVRPSKESKGSSVWSHVFSRIPTPAPATSQTALQRLKLLIQTTEPQRSYPVPFKVLIGPRII